MGHPFLAHINMGELLAKRIEAPFIPKVPDLNHLVEKTEFAPNVLELRETAIPSKSQEIVVNVNGKVFGSFGQYLDEDSPGLREKQRQRQREEALSMLEESSGDTFILQDLKQERRH